MKRIVHVLGGLNAGGSETLIMNYYRALDKNKYQFDFVIHTNKTQFYEEEIKSLGGKIYRMPRYKIYNHFNYVKCWKDFFSNEKNIDVIHGHMRSTASIYLLLAKKNNISTIMHSHSTSNGKNIKSLIQYFYQLPIRFIANYFIGCSYKACKWLFGKKVTISNKCQIIPNTVDIEKFRFNNDTRNLIRSKLNVSKDDIIVGNVGRFIKAKNHNLMIKILKKLNCENENYKLLLIGDGPEKQKIINKLKRNNLYKNSIILSSQKNIQDYYNAMDLFLFPSKYEGFGMTLVEAQINGLICITGKNIPNECIFSDNCHVMNYDSKTISEYIKNNKENIIYNERTIKNNNLNYYSVDCNLKKLCLIYDKLIGDKNE